MKPYFITCKEAMEARLLLQVRPLAPGQDLGVWGRGGGRPAGNRARAVRTCCAQVFFR